MELAINLTAIMISGVALITAVASLAMVIGMKLSTHKIEWKPLEVRGFDPVEDEKKEEEEDDFKVLDEAYRLAQEGKKKRKEKDPLDEILESSNF